MKRSARILIGALIGATLAFFLGTERGRKLRDRAEREVLPHLKEGSGWILDEVSRAEETSEDLDAPLQDKIEAVRKRLQEQQAAEND